MTLPEYTRELIYKEMPKILPRSHWEDAAQDAMYRGLLAARRATKNGYPKTYILWRVKGALLDYRRREVTSRSKNTYTYIEYEDNHGSHQLTPEQQLSQEELCTRVSYFVSSVIDPKDRLLCKGILQGKSIAEAGRFAGYSKSWALRKWKRYQEKLQSILKTCGYM